MNVKSLIAVMALTATWVGASGQCKKPEISPVWDSSKSQFKCVDIAATTRSDSDETVSPTGTKESCGVVRENLIKVCPSSDEGKTCKSKAKSIFNACYKGSKTGNEDYGGSNSTTSQTGRRDSSTCMTTYNQQQQACQARRLPPSSPGRPSAPDTCLQDAQAEQNKCFANSR